MSDCVLRVSEAIAVGCEHICFDDDGIGLLYIPRSKIDQIEAGAYQAFGPPTAKAIRRLMSTVTSGEKWFEV